MKQSLQTLSFSLEMCVDTYELALYKKEQKKKAAVSRKKKKQVEE